LPFKTVRAVVADEVDNARRLDRCPSRASCVTNNCNLAGSRSHQDRASGIGRGKIHRAASALGLFDQIVLSGLQNKICKRRDLPGRDVADANCTDQPFRSIGAPV
jgi:hypothetical protein